MKQLPSQTSLESIISSPLAITDLDNDVLRRRLRDAGRNLSVALEIPGDTIHRISKALKPDIPLSQAL